MAGVVVETGAGVANANSYVDRTYVRAFATARGLGEITGLDDDDTADAAIINAGDYLRNEQRYPFRGNRVAYDQTMPYPRSGASERGGPAIPSTVVPWRCKEAQALLAVKVLQGTSLQPSLANGGLAVQTKTIGPLTTTYMQPKDGMPQAEAKFPDVDGLLFPLLKDTGVPDADPSIFQTEWTDTPYSDTGYDNP